MSKLAAKIQSLAHLNRTVCVPEKMTLITVYKLINNTTSSQPLSPIVLMNNPQSLNYILSHRNKSHK